MPIVGDDVLDQGADEGSPTPLVGPSVDNAPAISHNPMALAIAEKPGLIHSAPFRVLSKIGSAATSPGVVSAAQGLVGGLGKIAQGAQEGLNPSAAKVNLIAAEQPTKNAQTNRKLNIAQQVADTGDQNADTKSQALKDKENTPTGNPFVKWQQEPGNAGKGAMDYLREKASAGAKPEHAIEALNQKAMQQAAAGDQAGYQATLKQIGEIAGAKTSEARAQQASQYQETEKFKKWQTEFNATEREKIANITANKAPAQILQTGMFAQSAMAQIADARQAFEQLQKDDVLGTVGADKLEDWIFGKGLIDPSLSAKDQAAIGKLRTALTYTSSAVMRAHTGRTSQEIYDDIKKTVGLGQSGETLGAALDQTDNLLGDYVSMASNANIGELRAGTTQKPVAHGTEQNPGYTVGKIYTGSTGKFKYIGGDVKKSTSWEKQP